MKLLFLGSGGSMGIPVIGCDCATCTSSSPFNNRFRPSVVLQEGTRNYLVDIGPDYRLQALKYGINTLDGVLLTHTHYDHIAGLDELRIYTFRKKAPVPCLLSRETLEELKIRYHYFIPPLESDEEHQTNLSFTLMEGGRGALNFEGLDVRYFSYEQQGMKVNGFRFGDLAYVTDILTYEDAIFEDLKGIETLILSGRRWQKSKGHLSIDEGIAFAKKAGAKQTYFTHISHEIEHEQTEKELPEGFALAYDGLKLEL